MTRRIVVTIDQLGNPVIDAQGFNGQGCQDATKLLEQALAGGAGDVTSVFKPEWHETEDVAVANNVDVSY